MSSKKVISFIIIASAILLFSAGVTVALILTNRHSTTPATITAYSFNFGEMNEVSIKEIGSSKMTLKNGIKFKPSKAVAWNEGYVHYSGSTIAEGVEFGTTSHSSYICVVPFKIKNGDAVDRTFGLDVQVASASEYMKNSVAYKVYVFETGAYIDIAEFQTFALIESGASRDYCLVAYSDEEHSANVNYGVDFANLNLEITKS
ncbi:MAG: hypothetical protein IJS68_03445 [Clostridia bacterium]|nr:hypothetical protein [Clostridia bacterium]